MLAMHENGHRFYDPETGRYTAPEPILRNPLSQVVYAYAGHSLPTYSYALNNPVRYWDMNGACPMCLIVGGAFIVMMWNDDTNWNGGGGAMERLGPVAASLAPLAPAGMSALSWQARLALASGGNSLMNRANSCVGRQSAFNPSGTVGNQAAGRPWINSNTLANQIFQAGRTIADPQGAPGRTLTVAEGTFSPAVNQTSVGQYELLLNEATNTIEHFNFVSH